MGMKPRLRRPRKSAQRERDLISELQKVYGYTIFDMLKKRDRYEELMRMENGTMRTVRMIQLACPEGSELYKAFVKKDDDEDKAAKERKAKRGKRKRNS